MGLEGHRATQRWVGLGTVCIFLNPTAKILKQDVGICTLHVHWFMITMIIICLAKYTYVYRRSHSDSNQSEDSNREYT